MTLDTVKLAPYNIARKFTRVEHILSGRGIPVLYNAVAGTSKTVHAAEVFALAKTDEHAAETLRLFTQIFASTAGDLVLAVGAWDGAFMFGSVAKGFAAVADLALFRQELEDKGPMRDRMKRLPVALVLKEDAALAGLARVRLPV
jgi:glucokinase